jgi:glycosyltransferase involved in cell wall biosynthesis
MIASPELTARDPRNRAAKSEPVKVTHVITSLTTGGAEMMLLKLIRSMDPARVKSSVIGLMGEGPVGGMMRDSGIPVRSLGLIPRQAISGVWQLARLLRRERPDIVQTWMYHADFFGSLASLAISGVPVMWNIRCGRPDPVIHKRGTFWISRACAAASPHLPERIICCSRAALEGHAAAGYDPDRMQVIPNGFDLEAFRPEPRFRDALRAELGLPPETVLVGMAARMDPAKDHRSFCEAAAIVSRVHPQVRFVLCGPEVSALNPVLKTWIETAGIGAQCHLLGLRNDMARIMAGLDILVSTSLVEGFSNVIGEAMACSVPCVATDVGDANLILGDAGFVAPVRNPVALAARILLLIGMGAERRSALGAAGRRRIQEHFSLEVVSRQYQLTYEQVASRCAA